MNFAAVLIDLVQAERQLLRMSALLLVRSVRTGKVIATLLAMCAAAAPTLAQTTSAPVVLRGVAWDSLRHAPLVGAFITLDGTSRSATSDNTGRFQFDSVARGTYSVTMQHDVLDSLGLFGITKSIVVASEEQLVTTSVPSFSTLR